jgi:hypothetical protein
MTAVGEKSADKFSVIGNYATKRGARTITFDEKSGNIFLPAAEFETNSATPNSRPRMIPGTFQVLVVH